MSLTANVYYAGKNGGVRRFTEETIAPELHHALPIMAKIAELRKKHGLRLRVARYADTL